MEYSKFTNYKISYNIIYYSDILKYTICYKCQTSACVLYGQVGTLTRCIGCGHYRKMIKLYKPNQPIFSIV